MKTLLLLLVVACGNVFAERFQLPIISWTDGDTIKTEFRSLPVPLNRVSIRILGIDTPESSKRFAKCYQERVFGKAVTLYVKNKYANNRIMYIDGFKWDKYGGRIDGTVYIARKNVGKHLIEMGYAVPYYGKAKTTDWCDPSILPSSIIDYMMIVEKDIKE